MDDKLFKKIADIRRKHPDWGRHRIAQEVKTSPHTVRNALDRLKFRREGELDIPGLARIAIKQLSANPIQPKSLAESLGIEMDDLELVIKEIEATHGKMQYSGAFLSLNAPSFGHIPIGAVDHGKWNRLGLVADTHLCCREERLDALHAQYDLFKKEGITRVLHAGNIVDGYIPRLNGASATATTIDDQAQYVVDNYPARKGITTYFITGDDHDGVWFKEGFNFGAYLQMMANNQDREDLVYIGHVESDVEFVNPTGGRSTIIKVQHPGGGSSYARSYTGQKQVEAFQGGEKPAILVQGHYHVSNYMNDRNIHVISMPGFQDQTVFARKKRLRMEIGGAILEFKTDLGGAVTRCKVEFNLFFDRGYYKAFLRSDAKLVKGHLVFNN